MFDEKKEDTKSGKRADKILRYPATDVLYGPADALIADCTRNRCFWRCTG